MTELEPYWLDEADWIVLLEFLSPDDAEDRARGAEAIGYLFGYAQMTDTRMLALVGDPDAGAYELLFSFSSPTMKARFLERCNRTRPRIAKATTSWSPCHRRSRRRGHSPWCCRTMWSSVPQSSPSCCSRVRTQSAPTDTRIDSPLLAFAEG